MDGNWFWIYWIVGLYVLGSLSPGDLVALRAGANIRSVGSGNPGAGNIYNELGVRAGVIVLVADLLTGAASTSVPRLADASGWIILASGGAVLVGHQFPIFWRFSGGVGGAVGLGTLYGFLPVGALVATLPALAIVLATRSGIFGVWLFVGIAAIVGWFLQGDILGIIGLAGAVLLPTFRWVIRYRITNVAAARSWLLDPKERRSDERP